MLGIVTNVFGHQESIAPISLTLDANNGWFEVDLTVFQKKKNISSDFNFFYVYEYMM